MSNPEVEYSLSKTENNIFSSLVMFGGQTKLELLLATGLKDEKAENALSSLIDKGFVKYDDETGVFTQSLPLENIINLLNTSLNDIEASKKDQTDTLQEYRKNIDDSLKKFRESLDKRFDEFKTSSSMLQSSFKTDLEDSSQQSNKRTEELGDTILTSFSTDLSTVQTDFKTSLSTESTQFEKEWMNAIDGFQKIHETGTRTLKESIEKYDKELSDIIKAAIQKITYIQTQLSDVVTSIETETMNQIREFYNNTISHTDDLKGNLENLENASWNNEKDFLKETQEKIQVTLSNKINKALQKVIQNLSKEIDKGINEAIDGVKQKTEIVIKESSEQIKGEFKEFVENSSELMQEQRIPLEGLSTELSKMSSEEKLTTISTTFNRQLQAYFTAELNSMETKYRRVQKSTTDIIENIRRSSKSNLINQSKDLEALIQTYNEVIEKSIARKDMDIERFQQLSQSIIHSIGNLLISVPTRAKYFNASLKDSIDDTISEIRDGMGETSMNQVHEVYSSLTHSQRRIETTFQETIEESKNEIQKVYDSSIQLGNAVTNLQSAYLEKIERVFEQRAKVMNTELEAITRNFKQVIKAIEGGFDNINSQVSSKNIIENIESSLSNSISLLKNDVETVFQKSQTHSQEFVTKLDTNLQVHIDRTLTGIEEFFSQIKDDFTTELKAYLELINENNKNQQDNLISTIDAFSDQNIVRFEEFNTSISKKIEESKKNIADFITESQKSTDEVIGLHKSNIDKYKEKGTTDILNFINQIESEVSTQNNRVKEALEVLESYYSSYSDSTLDEVTNLLRQVQESGDKLNKIVNDSFQISADKLSKITDNIDMYFSGSLTDLEIQIGAVTESVTSELDSSTKTIQNEIQVLEDELKTSVEELNTGIKDFISLQDKEFQTKIPELSQEYSQIFIELKQDREQSNKELQEKTEKNLTKFINDWNTEIETNKSKLQDITTEVDEAIKAHLENLEVIVKTNVEQTIQSFNTILNIESSKEDILGLHQILTKVKQANKRLKLAISESLESHLVQFEQKLIPELSTSYEAAHTQTEEDISACIEDFKGLISSSQVDLGNQLQNYLKEERKSFDFAETKIELNKTLRDFSSSATKDIESLSENLAESVQQTINDVDKSREEIQNTFTKLSSLMEDQNKNLLEKLEEFRKEASRLLEEANQDVKKSIIANLDSYNNDLDKTTLDVEGKTTKLTQKVTDELENQISQMYGRSQELLENLINSNNRHLETLQLLATETTRVKPVSDTRLIKLANDETKNEFIKNMIANASKQVTIITPNPTFLNVADIKAIPSEKRIFIITSFDFTKKGKKWVTEVGKPVNINFYKMKGKNVQGLLVIQDSESALVMPDTLGFTSTDEKLVSYLTGLVSLLKGPSIRLTS